MQVHPTTALIIIFTHAINGIANTLVARLAFMVLSSRSRILFFTLREGMFNLLTVVVLVPALILIVFESRQGVAESDQYVQESIVEISGHAADNLESWLGQKSRRISQLALRAGKTSLHLQHDLDFLRALDPDLLAVGVVDKEARSLAFSPVVDENGISTIGKDFSDRPYVAALQRTLQPQFSEVLRSKIGSPDPICVIVAPVLADSVYDGYTAGILDLHRVQQILALPALRSALAYTLLDQNQVVIATNRPDLTVMAPFSRGLGTMRQLVGGVSQWLPALPAKTPDAERWRQSSYVVEQQIGTLAEWRLIVEQPVAIMQQKLIGHYGKVLAIIFLILLATLVFAELLSRRFMRSVQTLQQISTGLAVKTEAVPDSNWPTSLIIEVNQLIVNFREMAKSLVQRFHETRQLNVTLEERVDERTRALQESEAKYRIIFENKVYAIYIFDLETRGLLDINDAFTALYGYSREEVMAGMMVDAINPWGEESDLVDQEVMREETMYIPLRYHRKRDGSIFPVEIVGGPYLWQGRRVVFAIASDITERRRATESLMERTSQLEDLTRNLEVRIEEEIERRRKNEQLMIQQAKLAAMGEMLGAIAHQWRQPLNTLGLCVQNIKDSYLYGVLNQGYLDTTVGQAMEQICHMSSTIDDFRSFFQPDKERVAFDTLQAVGEVLALFAAQLTAYDIAVTISCRYCGMTSASDHAIGPCSATVAEGYKNEFEHVILNLVTNAKDAICERREKGLMADGESGFIAFEFLDIDHTLVIQVNDNGGGVPEPLIARIFEPYFTTKEPAKGTGIGLYLAKIIVEGHMGGSLTVTNIGPGASFAITLPRPR
jgi:PAS domain S-box-containing protein